MPSLGDTKIVYYKTSQTKCVYHACIECGKERWVYMVKGKPKNLHCKKCGSGGNLRTHDNVPRNKSRDRLILRICPDCSRKDWVLRGNGTHINEPASPRCLSCAARKRKLKHWARGRAKEGLRCGRATVALDKSSPYWPMANGAGFVAKSRLILAEFLGRCLTSKECVHHINKNILDDRIENLELMTNSSHSAYHKKVGGK